jgi:hypothetical protein
MTARSLPPRPDLDQLKRQAKELLESWKAAPPDATRPMRLRDAQRAIAEQYGFDSWDTMRTHVLELAGGADPGRRRPHRGMDYNDPIPDVVALGGSLSRDDVRRLVERGVSGVKVDPSIPADALAALADLQALARLDLSNRDDLTDDDLAFLERMPWLTAVSLAGCGRITDAGVGHLRRHRALEQINLQWTNTGDQSVVALAGQSALARVVLGRRLTDVGAASLRNFPALATRGALDSFLSVSSSKALTDDALASLGRLAGVRALDLHMSAFGSPHYTARGAAHLRGMLALEELNFYGPLVNDAVLREIAAIPRLRWLHAQDTASGDDGFIALAACATLENLSARFCPRITDRGFAAVAGLPRLTRLCLGGPQLSDSAMAFLVDAPALVELAPNLFGDDAFRFIGQMRRLERLTNMYNRRHHRRCHTSPAQSSAPRSLLGVRHTNHRRKPSRASHAAVAREPRVRELRRDYGRWTSRGGSGATSAASLGVELHERQRHLDRRSTARNRGQVRAWTARTPDGLVRLVTMGTIAGIGATFALGRIVRASGGGGSFLDPRWPAFVIPIGIIVAIAALATFVPSRRALRINPAILLRSDC